MRPANRLPGDATTFLPLVLSPGISVFTIKPLGEVFRNELRDNGFRPEFAELAEAAYQQELDCKGPRECKILPLSQGRAAPRNAGERIQNSVAGVLHQTWSGRERGRVTERSLLQIRRNAAKTMRIDWKRLGAGQTG